MDRSEVVTQFTASLDRLDVAWTRVGKSALTGALQEILDGPAVGASLPYDDVSLSALGVSVNPTPRQIREANTGVTAALLGVADYGTVVVEGKADSTEAASLFPDLHVAVLPTSDIVPNMEAAFEHLAPLLREEATTAILATGPSATADMGALVKGAHGPTAVHVLLVDGT
jgi:L-lactate dehydrogenase complex protein LldG